MEQNNIEQLIKNRIRERSIKPAPEARERLINVLNSKPKKKKNYWIRYAIAASLLLALFFNGVKMLLKNDEINQLDEIIIQKEIRELKQNEKSEFNKNNNPVVFDEELEVNLNKEKVKEPVTIIKQSTVVNKVKKSNPLGLEKENKLEVINGNVIPKKELVAITPVAKKDSIIINTKAQFRYITAKDLLAEVTTDTTAEQIQISKKTPQIYIKTNQLLVDIEKELFYERNKNFLKKAKRQFKNVKKAVASRNYEH